MVSLGFKYGLPYNSDLVFDVRFLPNPNAVLEFKSKTGQGPSVIDFMQASAETEEILFRICDMLEYLLPKYKEEVKTYLTVTVGCTGGGHRSVMVANGVEERLETESRKINLIHRDLHDQ